MNAIRKMIPDTSIVKEKVDITLVEKENHEVNKEAEKISKDYLNEKLFYFYNNGGPVMDI